MVAVDRIMRVCATLGPVGYVAYAPGTGATCVALLFFYGIGFSLWPLMGQVLFCGTLLVASLYVVQRAQRFFAQPDPSCIVIDEVVGCCCALIVAPHSVGYYLLVGLLFRLFDIYKPWGIRRIESIPGALGIVLDDVMAGVYALVGAKIITVLGVW